MPRFFKYPEIDAIPSPVVYPELVRVSIKKKSTFIFKIFKYIQLDYKTNVQIVYEMGLAEFSQKEKILRK